MCYLWKCGKLKKHAHVCVCVKGWNKWNANANQRSLKMQILAKKVSITFHKFIKEENHWLQINCKSESWSKLIITSERIKCQSNVQAWVENWSKTGRSNDQVDRLTTTWLGRISSNKIHDERQCKANEHTHEKESIRQTRSTHTQSNNNKRKEKSG